MKIQHTPGPWQIDRPTLGKFCFHITAKGFHVAAIQKNVPASAFKAEEANAHLIAALPDLLAVVQALVDAGGIMEPSEWFTKARAAIAKATPPTTHTP